MTTDLWDGHDVQIICEAHLLSKNPVAMFAHIGFYFSQPLLQLAFLAEYRFSARTSPATSDVNLLIHVINSFMVYMLVHMLFPRKKMAVLAGAPLRPRRRQLRAGLHDDPPARILLLACLHLLVLYFFIRNDFRRDGSVRSSLFLVGLVLFLLTGLTKAARSP